LRVFCYEADLAVVLFVVEGMRKGDCKRSEGRDFRDGVELYVKLDKFMRIVQKVKFISFRSDVLLDSFDTVLELGSRWTDENLLLCSFYHIKW
jgi:hypothetical protein